MIKYANILRTYSETEIAEFENKYVKNFGDGIKQLLNGQNCKVCGRNVFQNYDRFNKAVSYGNNGSQELNSCPHCDVEIK